MEKGEALQEASADLGMPSMEDTGLEYRVEMDMPIFSYTRLPRHDNNDSWEIANILLDFRRRHVPGTFPWERKIANILLDFYRHPVVHTTPSEQPSGQWSLEGEDARQAANILVGLTNKASLCPIDVDREILEFRGLRDDTISPPPSIGGTEEAEDAAHVSPNPSHPRPSLMVKLRLPPQILHQLQELQQSLSLVPSGARMGQTEEEDSLWRTAFEHGIIQRWVWHAWADHHDNPDNALWKQQWTVLSARCLPILREEAEAGWPSARPVRSKACKNETTLEKQSCQNMKVTFKAIEDKGSASNEQLPRPLTFARAKGRIAELRAEAEAEEHHQRGTQNGLTQQLPIWNPNTPQNSGNGEASGSRQSQITVETGTRRSQRERKSSKRLQEQMDDLDAGQGSSRGKRRKRE